MSVDANLKSLVLTELKRVLHHRALELQSAIQSLKESRDTSTKSSAGDKHETSRAMLQNELDKSEAQLQKLINTTKELAKINVEKKYGKAESGALVNTDQGLYFISIGYGKVELQGKIIYCISLASPLGSMLQNKVPNDRFIFNDKVVHIKDIV